MACAVLAAGASRRMGRPKQLLPIDGEPLIRRIVETACMSSCEHVAVVLGAHAEAIASVLGGTRATLLRNDGWSEGMASSLRAAVLWARALDAEAVLVAACDQPHLTSAHLDALAAVYRTERRSVASAYQGTLGIPAVLAASLFDRLLTIRGDRGAAAVLRGHPQVSSISWPEGAYDLDTPEDL